MILCTPPKKEGGLKIEYSPILVDKSCLFKKRRFRK